MTQTATRSASATYTVADIEKVHRRARADLVMIAESTGALTVEKAHAYADDIELLAKHGCLRAVDVTLMGGQTEVRALRYDVNTEAGSLSTTRPGGVMWPKVNSPWLRIVLSYTKRYDAETRARLRPELKISWGPSYADTSHSALKSSGGRDYASNGYGLQRKDWN